MRKFIFEENTSRRFEAQALQKWEMVNGRVFPWILLFSTWSEMYCGCYESRAFGEQADTYTKSL